MEIQVARKWDTSNMAYGTSKKKIKHMKEGNETINKKIKHKKQIIGT